MKSKILTCIILLPIAISFLSCNNNGKQSMTNDSLNVKSAIDEKLDKYINVKLTADLSHLSSKEKQLIPIFIEIAKIADEIYWEQTFGDKKTLLDTIKNEKIKQYVMINYGPWEILNGNKPFVSGFGDKPLGANFYPKDMTKDEFEKLADKEKTSAYTVIRRNKKGQLEVIPYHVAYKIQVDKISKLLKQAAELAENEGFKKYLNLRSEAFLNDNYQPSDFAWMEMKNSNLDFVIGPIENYEDALFNYKTSHEAFILLKDVEWSKKLTRYAALLPKLQKDLPVDAKYKKETPGADSDMNVYDALYYAGDCNSGSKSIAINLPNDEVVQLKKGTRKLQLKNSMKAKFDNILMPIAKELIVEEQLKNVKFDAFFNNVMFHEVAHGMGIKNTIDGKNTVRKVLKEQYSALEEGKADILGLYLVTKLHEKGEIKECEMMDFYVTFLAGIFRSVRFGVASDHGKANMVRFYYLQNNGAFSRNEHGKYAVNLEKMKEAVVTSVQQIIKIQGDGNYNEAKKMIEENGSVKDLLQKDLDNLKTKNIPVDIVFEQGLSVLGLK